MTETAEFFAALDRLALWIGRLSLTSALLLMVLGLVWGLVTRHRERRRRPRYDLPTDAEGFPPTDHKILRLVRPADDDPIERLIRETGGRP